MIINKTFEPVSNARIDALVGEVLLIIARNSENNNLSLLDVLRLSHDAGIAKNSSELIVLGRIIYQVFMEFMKGAKGANAQG